MMDLSQVASVINIADAKINSNQW